MARPAGPCIGVDLRDDGARVVVTEADKGVVDVRQTLARADAAVIAEACGVFMARSRRRPQGIGLAVRDRAFDAAADFARVIASATGLPCRVAGAGTCALMTVFAQGSWRGRRDVALLSLGEALHVGIWLHGKPLHGNGRDPDVAHWPLDPAGERCLCGGRGCAHTLLGPTALARTAALAQLPVSAGHGGGDLAGRAEAGDPMARAVLQRMADQALLLARGLVAAYGITTLALHWPTAAQHGVVTELLRATVARQLPGLAELRIAALDANSIAEGAARWAMRRTP